MVIRIRGQDIWLMREVRDIVWVTFSLWYNTHNRKVTLLII